MTSRSLTEFFVLFRNNVIQNKNIYSDNVVKNINEFNFIK